MLSNLIIAASVFISAIQPVISEPISLPGAPLSLFSKRQSDPIASSGIPPQCTTLCQPVVDAINSPGCANGPASCLCTQSLATAFKSCLDCAVANDPADVSQDLADGDIQALNEACSAAGTPVTIAGSGASSSATGASSSSFGFGTTSTVTPTTSAQAGGSTTITTPANSASTTTPASLPGTGAGVGAGAGSGSSTDTTTTSTSTTSAPTTSTSTTANSSARGLSTSAFGAVVAAVLAGTSFAVAF